MSWQEDLFQRVRNEEWHTLGELYAAVETQIPIHYAMRAALRESRVVADADLPCLNQARWRKFCQILSQIGVEHVGENARGFWRQPDRVRLKPQEGRECPFCHGPVYRVGWSGRTPSTPVTCLACEEAARQDEWRKLVTIPPPPPPPPALVPPPERIMMVRLGRPKPFARQPIKPQPPPKPPLIPEFEVIWDKPQGMPDRPSLLQNIQKFVYPRMTIKQIDWVHRHMNVKALWYRYQVRFWLGKGGRV